MGQLSCTPALMVVRKHQAKRAVKASWGKVILVDPKVAILLSASLHPPTFTYAFFHSLSQQHLGQG